jgi:hypothetical protein
MALTCLAFLASASTEGAPSCRGFEALLSVSTSEVRISDPGPIADEDFVTLAPGEGVQVPVTTPLGLESLEGGAYKAHVVVWVDPYELGSRCRTEDVPFRVR